MLTKKISPGVAFCARAMISGKHFTNFHACTQNGCAIQRPLRKKIV